ncbi:hypothetical protein MUK42_28421 [Musa troglodytarum]|uniref:AP2/ERF domain-containing protein n=1 Tax=Musa troglodytarum TaxID=320322 RepID=A0A9E7JN41_9LILI|nr:hypothetical protein MUK42_28421 [Musa troglodytarum]
MQMQTHTSAREQQHILRARNSVRSSHRESPSEEERADEEASRTALSSFRMKEEQIERKKMEVREKVFAQLGRVEEESKRLAVIRKELEAMADPTSKEVSALRKKIDAVNSELKPLGQNCLKKEEEYKEALETFDGKNREKAQLVDKLMELDLGSQVVRKEGEAVALEFEESSLSSSSPSSSSCSSPTGVSTGGSTSASRALGPSPKRKGGRKKFRETRHPVYHGVRERNGGRWVCEVRELLKKNRIWLGTFRAPEMAALAHDVAAIALRGGSAQLNFPDLAGALPRARSTTPVDLRLAAAKAAEMLRPLKSSPAPLPAVSDAGGSQGREEREENTTNEDAAAPPTAVFVDEDELFNVPGLMEDMARGLLLTPPALQRRGFDWDIAVEEEQEIDLSPLWNHG